MTSNDEITRLLPRVKIDLEAINNAWAALDRVNRCAHCHADGFVLLMYFSARAIEASQLSIENHRLSAAITEERRRTANLLAAIRAALSAEHDGESDPLWYLRDEYGTHKGRIPETAGGDAT
ncbi:hypothetical protein [Streptomyces phytophilus]|uniref:hypothetical protein n=1 Tax=Streptomyces phytophilus TaxID=722715 RepID=UPI0015F0FD86|nr:hypothetical protein [Streptomyces phytophilus]